MAKSARASDRKSARTKIRANVYAPVEEARIQRLSEKLLALAATSKPPPLMEVGEESPKAQTAEQEETKGAMDVDQPITSTSKKQFKGRRKQGKSKLAVIFKGTKGPKKVGKRFKK